MATKNSIGLDSAAIKKVINTLGDLLASHQIYYTNLRGLHWDIKGDKFFELHQLYEEYYNNEASIIDEVAERIIKLGGHPENRFSEYIKKSSVKETHGVSDWAAGIKNVIATMKTLLGKYRDLLTVAAGANDVGTVSLARKQIIDLETSLWKLTTYMG